MSLYFSKYLNPLSVNVIYFLPFLSLISFIKFLEIKSLKYSEKLFEDKFEYLNNGVGLIELLFYSYLSVSIGFTDAAFIVM